MTQKNILFLQAKLVQDSKMFGEGDGLPDSAETLHEHIFLHYRYLTIIFGESLSSNAFNVCQTALGTIVYRDLQFTSGTRIFSATE